MSLRPAFVYRPTFSCESVADELLALAQVSWWRGPAAIAFDWAVILGVIALAEYADRPAAYLAAIAVVAARQHALLVLMHDAAHFRLFPNRRWNERLADWFCAYPHLVSTEGYRRDHLQHHRYLNTNRDPNWVAKIDSAEWRFPKTRRELAWLFLKDVAGVGFLRLLLFMRRYQGAEGGAQSAKSQVWNAESGKRKTEREGGRPEGRRERRGTLARRGDRLAYYGVAAALITWLGIWPEVALFWLLPLFTLLPAILRLRVIAEHHGLERRTDLDHSRNYHANWIERFFLAPHNVWLHLDHHLFPAIPHYRLPQAHALLETIPEYRAQAHQSRAILLPYARSVLDEITGGRQSRRHAPRTLPPDGTRSVPATLEYTASN